MPGIYLHIPFCKQACHYCNFHFSTSLRAKPAMTAALIRELELQADYLNGATLSSVYFGGGTPSLLDTAELAQIFETINRLHHIAPDAEITLEANPDDLTAEKLRDLRQYTPVNRLSIGIQSFSEADLRWMNRAHSAAEARASLELSLAAGFDDLTIDLIYGAPTTSDAQWAENVAIALDLGIPHLSCYCLTVEDGTALGTFVKRGQQPPVEEEKAARQFEYLMQTVEKAGYDHYEISNFAKSGRYARHNSSYWLGEPYLGVGPSAHSYNGVSRQWNVANNAQYIRALDAGEIPFEIEHLTPAQRYNEYIMTTLRTIWGASPAHIQSLGAPFLQHFETVLRQMSKEGWLEQTGENWRLTRAGKLLADRIAVDFFYGSR
ncbi:MAG: radical SAM family heme chaperone HemW [Bacteroidota bacterium]